MQIIYVEIYDTTIKAINELLKNEFIQNKTINYLFECLEITESKWFISDLSNYKKALKFYNDDHYKLLEILEEIKQQIDKIKGY